MANRESAEFSAEVFVIGPCGRKPRQNKNGGMLPTPSLTI